MEGIRVHYGGGSLPDRVCICRYAYARQSSSRALAVQCLASPELKLHSDSQAFRKSDISKTTSLVLKGLKNTWKCRVRQS